MAGLVPIGAKLSRSEVYSSVPIRHDRACPGYPRRDVACLYQNSNTLVCSRRCYFLKPAMLTTAWIAGTSPAMTNRLDVLL
jgi:hypothetical protein